MNKTSLPPIDSIDRQWYVVDAENQTLGRLATEVAAVLRGKNNPAQLTGAGGPKSKLDL